MAVRVLGEPVVDFGSQVISDMGTVSVFNEPAMNFSQSLKDVGDSVSVLTDVTVQFDSILAKGGERISDPYPLEVTYYRMRALDLGTPVPVPVYWTSLRPDFSGAPSPPNGGPYGDPQILGRWTQRTPARI